MDNFPGQRVNALLGDKWGGHILLQLGEEPSRFGELKRQLSGITAKTLTSSLRRLEEQGLASRHAYPTIPPRVEYQLTAVGLQVQSAYAVLCDVLEHSALPMQHSPVQLAGHGSVARH